MAELTDVDGRGRLAELTLSGKRVKASLAEAVIGTPSLSLSTAQVGEVTFTVKDDGLKLLESGLVNRRTAARFLGLDLEVAALETSSAATPRLTVTLRAAGAQRMRRADGPLVRRNLSPTSFLESLARTHGLAFVGEPSAARQTIARAEPAAGTGEERESDWELGQRLAQELGFIMFESAGTLTFARPSWLLARSSAQVTRWAARWDRRRNRSAPRAAGTELVLRTMPGMRASDDAEQGATGSIEVDRTNGIDVRPGHRVDLHGIPTFDGAYLVSSVSADLDGRSPVMLDLETPDDPEPQPAADDDA